MSKEKKDRSQEAVRVAAPGRTQRALKAGAHSSQIHGDGSSQAEANKHKPTNGGNNR
jgi:hypothetical protein